MDTAQFTLPDYAEKLLSWSLMGVLTAHAKWPLLTCIPSSPAESTSVFSTLERFTTKPKRDPENQTASTDIQLECQTSSGSGGRQVSTYIVETSDIHGFMKHVHGPPTFTIGGRTLHAPIHKGSDLGAG